MGTKARRVAKKGRRSNQSGNSTERTADQPAVRLISKVSAAFVMLPTGTEGAVIVAVESQAGEVCNGQPGYPVATLNELAREADAARRER